MKRVIGAVAVAALLTVGLSVAVPASAASPRTWIVKPGSSVQAAVNKAKPGDTVLVAPGVYRESVTITKDGISLRGAGTTGGTIFKPPAKLKGRCVQVSGGSGVCVLGTLNDQFEVTDRVRDVTVSGIRFIGWPSMGVFAIGTENLSLIGNTVSGAGEYGLARFDSVGGVVQGNTVVGGGEAGIYVGDSAGADAVVAHNDVTGSLFGIFIRHSSGVTAQFNHAWNNCEGIFVLDDGGPGGVSDITLRYNVVVQNNKVCPATDEDPALSGGGIFLLGATESTVVWNTVRGNVGTDVNSGGIVLTDGAGLLEAPQAPVNNVIANNSVFGNSPSDISFDGSGTGNDLGHNFCGTSAPAGSCL